MFSDYLINIVAAASVGLAVYIYRFAKAILASSDKTHSDFLAFLDEVHAKPLKKGLLRAAIELGESNLRVGRQYELIFYIVFIVAPLYMITSATLALPLLRILEGYLVYVAGAGCVLPLIMAGIAGWGLHRLSRQLRDISERLISLRAKELDALV